MQPLALALIITGAGVSALGVSRFIASRRQVLAPGEVGINAGRGFLVMAAGDAMLLVGVLLLVL